MIRFRVAGVTRSPKEQIVLAAERLIADHGVDGVSVRQIGAAAGNGNNHRLAQTMALIVHAAADRERARARRRAILPFAVELGNLLDGTVGFLEAPESATSQAALEDTDSSAFHPTLLV